MEAQKANNMAVADLIDALREASRSNANAVQPALESYFDNIAKEILVNDRQNVVNLEKLIIDPINNLYHNDIKMVDAKKRDFDERSKEYYKFLGNYLGQRSDSKEKKRQESDKKYEDRRRNFELQRFDYSSFMQDLHGGRKDQEVLSQLTRYAQAQAQGFLSTAKKIENLIPQLDALTSEVSQADKDFLIHRSEREERRRAIEKGAVGIELEQAGFTASQNSVSPSALPRRTVSAKYAPPNGLPIGATTPQMSSDGFGPMSNASDYGLHASSVPNTSMLATSPGSSRFKGYRDLEERDQSASGPAVMGQRKEGLVWALSRPGSHADPIGLNKQAWHKFWIVLDQGTLSEYTNWKQSLDLNMDPIDLRVASVREARNADRRFCFEIITPQFTRVYQAPNEDELRAWITTINNALQSAVEGKGKTAPITSAAPSTPSSIRKDIASVLTGKSASTGHRSGYAGSSNRIPSRHSTVADRPNHMLIEIPESSEKLVKQLREADLGNQYCADCNADQKVDWVSLNLGVIICIECSGIHRSLGTHISKVRSLTLDPNAFTADVVEIFLQLGNRVANMVWEAKLDRSLKPSPQSNREQRLHFITAKYSQRLYVQPLSPTLSAFSTPDETLLASIKKNDIVDVTYALALGANPNCHDKSRSTHAIYLALAAADPAAPSSAMPSSTPSRSTTTTARKAFALAELLFLNGSEIPNTPAPIPLSASARQYLDRKAEQRGVITALPTNVGP